MKYKCLPCPVDGNRRLRLIPALIEEHTSVPLETQYSSHGTVLCEDGPGTLQSQRPEHRGTRSGHDLIPPDARCQMPGGGTGGLPFIHKSMYNHTWPSRAGGNAVRCAWLESTPIACTLSTLLFAPRPETIPSLLHQRPHPPRTSFCLLLHSDCSIP